MLGGLLAGVVISGFTAAWWRSRSVRMVAGGVLGHRQAAVSGFLSQQLLDRLLLVPTAGQYPGCDLTQHRATGGSGANQGDRSRQCYYREEGDDYGGGIDPAVDAGDARTRPIHRRDALRCQPS